MRMSFSKTIKHVLFSCIILALILAIHSVKAQKLKDKVNQNEINWLLDRYKYQDIRGGTTKGLDVELDESTSRYFQELQDMQSDKKSKDRLAILSMVGEYRCLNKIHEDILDIEKRYIND